MPAEPTVIELRNDLAELARLTEAVDQLGARYDLSPRTISEVNLALEEIVTNIISYGFDGPGDHLIKICLSMEDRQLTSQVEDDGRPFDPLQAPGPDVTAALEDRDPGGLGILLVRRFMDDVSYSRNGDRNILLMKKYTGLKEART
ncbi:MAG: ATP-binding protein [Acidobacteriota bacterium]